MRYLSKIQVRKIKKGWQIASLLLTIFKLSLDISLQSPDNICLVL